MAPVIAWAVAHHAQRAGSKEDRGESATKRSRPNPPRKGLFQYPRRTLSQALLGSLVFGLIGVIVGIVATEVIGAIMTRSTPTPPTAMWVGGVAALLGYALGGGPRNRLDGGIHRAVGARLD